MYIIKIIRHPSRLVNVYSADNFRAPAREIAIIQGKDKYYVPLGSYDKIFITNMDGKTIESWTASEDPDAVEEE